MHKRGSLTVTAIVLGTALSLHGPSRAAEPAAGKVAVAVVNMDRIMKEAKPVAQLDTEVKATLANQQRQLDHLYAGRLLDDKERGELETLQKVASPNDGQKKRMAELAKLSDDRQAELDKLARMEKPSDAERARRTQLANWLDRQNQRVIQLQETLGQARTQKQGDVYQRAMNAILTVVQAVAQERGIEMVVDRGSVLFSRDDRDITEVVLQRLNGGAAAKSAPKK